MFLVVALFLASLHYSTASSVLRKGPSRFQPMDINWCPITIANANEDEENDIKSDPVLTIDDNSEVNIHTKCIPAIPSIEEIPYDVEENLSGFAKDPNGDEKLLLELVKIPSALRIKFHQTYLKDHQESAAAEKSLPPLQRSTGWAYGSILQTPAMVSWKIIESSLKSRNFELILQILFSFTNAANEDINKVNMKKYHKSCSKIVTEGLASDEHILITTFIANVLKASNHRREIDSDSKPAKCHEVATKIIKAIEKGDDFQEELYRFLEKASVAQLKHFIEHFKGEKENEGHDFYEAMAKLPKFAAKPISEIARLVENRYKYTAERIHRILTVNENNKSIRPTTWSEYDEELELIVLGHAETDLVNIIVEYNKLPAVKEKKTNFNADVEKFISGYGGRKTVYKAILNQAELTFPKPDNTAEVEKPETSEDNSREGDAKKESGKERKPETVKESKSETFEKPTEKKPVTVETKKGTRQAEHKKEEKPVKEPENRKEIIGDEVNGKEGKKEIRERFDKEKRKGANNKTGQELETRKETGSKEERETNGKKEARNDENKEKHE